MPTELNDWQMTMGAHIEDYYLPKWSVSAGLHSTTHALDRTISEKQLPACQQMFPLLLEQSINHLLLQCPVATDFWNVFCCFCLFWSCPSLQGFPWTLEFIGSWQNHQEYLEDDSQLYFWCLWIEKNKRYLMKFHLLANYWRVDA